MISTPVLQLLDKMFPPQSGRGAPSSDPAAADGFAGLVSRLFVANLPVSALARAPEFPDTTTRLPEVARAEPDPEPEIEEGAAQASPLPPRHRGPSGLSDADAPPPPDVGEAVGAGAPADETASPAAAFEPMQTPPRPQAAPGAGAPAQQADRPAAQATPATPQAKDGEAPPPAPQQARQVGATPTDTLRAQVIDGSPDDRLPALGHTLTGRAALVAQADGSHAVAAKDASAPRTGIGDQAAALLGGNAQAGAASGQKAKGTARPANAAAAAQAASGTQTSQASATPQQVVPPAQAAMQPGFDAALLAASGGTGKPGGGLQQGMRNEPLPLAGGGAPSAMQAGFRIAAPAAASKPRLPVPPRFVADQVAVQIRKSLDLGNDRISIQLKPAELGKVEVRLDVGHEGRVTAVITADRADTLDLLQRDARILQHSLQDAGLRADSNSLTFELRGQGQQGYDTARNDADGGSGIGDAGSDDAAPLDRAPLPPRGDILTNDRVDIHV